ncbi:non-homologous end-joining DNA ligase [Marinicrinis lubricantis]
MPVKEKLTVRIGDTDIPVTNPDKYLWPDENISKLDYVKKLAFLSPFLLKYCGNRYLTTIRYPNGITGKSFYQKSCPEPKPDYIQTGQLESTHYVIPKSPADILWLGNLACLEFHPSLHVVDSMQPAEWIIDMDPTSPDGPDMAEAACLVGELLTQLQIHSIPKTSGATGIQIYIPIEQGPSFEQLRVLGQFIAEFMVTKHPRIFTIERMTKDRGDKIYLDYLQHWYGKTLASPYTPRAKPGAPVSTPLAWDELALGFDPKRYNLFTIEERLTQLGDLIDDVPKQSLSEVIRFVSRHKS